MASLSFMTVSVSSAKAQMALRAAVVSSVFLLSLVLHILLAFNKWPLFKNKESEKSRFAREARGAS